MAVIIGKDYKDSFESVRALVLGGCAPADVRIDADGRIVRGGYAFELSDASAGIDSTDGDTVGMDSHAGASWFAALRGDRRDNGLALWKDLIETVREYFHKYNSLTDLGVPLSPFSAEERRRRADTVAALSEMFFPSFAGYAEVRERRRGDGLCEYYGINLRVELGSGAGDAVPVLAKMYVRRTESGLVPVTGGETRDIEGLIGGRTDRAVRADEEPFPDAYAVIDEVFAATENALKEGRLGEYMYFARERDRKEVSSLVGRMATDARSLECTALRVLGISRVRLPEIGYEIVCDGVAAVRALSDASGRVSLSCAACGVPLMVNGRVSCGGGRVFDLDFGAKNFGLTEEDVAYIRKNSAFGEHLLPNKCGNPRCRRRICLPRQVVAGGMSGRGVCLDCPYPEVVFTSEDGKPMYTPDLAFARDRMTLIPKEKTGMCASCGRTFAADALTGTGINRMCAFCRNAEKEAASNSAEARRLYRKYAGMLGYGVRLKHLAARKYCFDDDDITLFVLGGDKYILDKTEITGEGFIDKPRRVN